MGIEQATEALEQNLETQSTPAPEQGQPTGPFNLDTAEKFMWKGKEYTPAQLEKLAMFQSDYTKKSQALAEERKYYENLQHDLDAVRTNPQLMAKFKEIYPEKFHSYLANVMPKDWQTQPKEESSLPPEVQDKLDRFDNYVREQEISKASQMIDSITTKLEQKYPDALSDVVLARAQSIVESGRELSEGDWEKLYKQSHDYMVGKYKERQTKQFNDVRNSNLKARGMGPGGGTPGQAPAKRTFSQATDDAIAALRKN